MTKAKPNPFDVLKKLSEDDCKSLKLFTGNNVRSASTGKGNWGSVTIAVDNQTIIDLINEDKTRIRLIVYNADHYATAEEKLKEATHDPEHVAE